ncbi:MAG: DoxX family protein [Bryobacteraceae bacterium]
MERCDGRWQGIGIAALRWIVGVVFLVHGSQKLFVYGFHGFAQYLVGAGIPLASVSAVVVTLVEFLGGIALILGALTRWAAALLAINMAVAVLAVHVKHGFFLPAGGYEYALTLLVANLSLMLAGGGVCALDNLFCRARAPQPEVRPNAA